MSWEGYEQHICANGHQFLSNPIEFMYTDDHAKCFCGADPVWNHLVDETNGFDPENPSTYPVVLEVDKPAEYCVCETCGNAHMTKHPTYKVPK